jgi:hypothetical protein
MGKATFYHHDFLEWAQQQAEYLQNGHWAELDIENLVEELEALGRSEQREFGRYLQVLMMHLLKCQYQPERRTKSWDATLSNCRNKIHDCLEDTPSLQPFLQDPTWVEKYYRRACRDAIQETEEPPEIFPEGCPYTIDQILDPRFPS